MRFCEKLIIVIRACIAIAPCVLLSACFMVGPDYQEPSTNVMEHWLDADTHTTLHNHKTRGKAQQTSPIRESFSSNRLWWSAFQDRLLVDFINRGYHNNLSIQSAGARVLQARAELAQSVGNLYPQQQAATGNHTYLRTGGSSLKSVLPPEFESASLGLIANWELDFWGKYRRAIRSNDATFLASIAAYDNALVTLTADIADNYIKFRTNQAQIMTTRANIQVQAMGLKIARSRYRAGQTSFVDVAQAQTELLETESSLPMLMADQQRQKDALALLLGTTPQGVNALLGSRGRIPKAQKMVGIGIPKETMARRPDIYQARLQAIAQSNAIGAIKANLYPAFTLVGSFSFSANTINGQSLSDLFRWSNRNVTAGPGFNWPILNYGQITNAVRAQDAVFQQALLQYMDIVLKAQKEVQDAITAFVEAQKAEGLLIKANRSAMRSLQLALVRYREGETDFTPVLNAEQQQLRIQTSLITAQGRIPEAYVALFRALGGGWEIRGCNDVVSNETKAQMAARTNWGSLLKAREHQAPKNSQDAFKALYLPKW